MAELPHPVKKHFLTSSYLNKNYLSQPDATKIIHNNEEENTPLVPHTLGFDSTGKSFSVLDFPSENNPKIHVLESSPKAAVCDDILTQQTLEISNLPISDRFNSCLYDSELNCLFIFINNRNEHHLGLKINIFGFWLDSSKYDSSACIVFNPTSTVKMSLDIEGINLYTKSLVKAGQTHYIALFARGLKYGFKSYQVDYSEGPVIHLIQYNSARNSFLHHQQIQLEVGIVENNLKNLELFLDATASKIYLLEPYSPYVMRELSSSGEKLHTYEVQTEKYVDFIEQCSNSTFLYVTEDMIVYLVNLCNGKIHILKEFSLCIGVDGIQRFRLFSMFKSYGKVLLSMQNSNCRVILIDVLREERVCELPLQYPVSSINLNWNMTEMAVTRCNSHNHFCFSVYKLPAIDLSLKHISRVAILTNFSFDFLVSCSLPTSLKRYLEVI